MAGVLFRWRPRQLLLQALPQRATDQAQAAFWEREIFQGYGGDWGEFDRGTVTVPQLVQRISQRTGLSAQEVMAVVEAVPQEMQAIEASVALVHQLADAGHRLHYLSNMPEPFAAHLLAHNDFFRRFDSGIFSCRAGFNKPETGIFEAACQRFAAAPEELLFLDDVPANVHAARALGWHAVQFVDAAQALRELQQLGWVQFKNQSHPIQTPAAFF
jgi:putative hydrolase of the HAD superfamily